jgi:hypothetical protein
MPLRFTMSVSYQYSEQFLCGLNLQSTSGCPKTEQGRYYRVPNEQPASALYAFYPREKDFYALSIEERGLTGACFFGTFKSAEHHLPMGYHGQYLINRACNTCPVLLSGSRRLISFAAINSNKTKALFRF